MKLKHPELRTARLTLRCLQEEDASDIKRLAGAKEIADTTLSIPHPYPLEAALEWISKYHKEFKDGTNLVFGITLTETGELCGTVGLTIEREHDRAELGFWTGLEYWNKGVCTEAAQAVLRHGFENLNLHRIFARHFAGNLASGKVMRKLGMKYEGWMRHHIRKQNHYEDIVCYGILQSDWRAQQGS